MVVVEKDEEKERVKKIRKCRSKYVKRMKVKKRIMM